MIGWFFPCSIGKKPFLVFQRVSVKEVEHLIDVSSLASCDLVDPVPSRILKGCKSTLLPTLTSIVNLSLQSACMLLCEQRLHFRGMKWRAKGSLCRQPFNFLSCMREIRHAIRKQVVRQMCVSFAGIKIAKTTREPLANNSPRAFVLFFRFARLVLSILAAKFPGIVFRESIMLPTVASLV